MWILLIIWLLCPFVLIPMCISQHKDIKDLRESNKKLQKDLLDSNVKVNLEKVEPIVKPEGIKPEEVKFEEVKPEEIKPEEVKFEEIKPEEIKPEEIKPEEIKFEEIKPEEVKPEEIKPEEVRFEEIRPEDVVPDEPEPIEIKIPPEEILRDTNRVSTSKSGTVMFGIGVLFVLVAGIIFATTTWNKLPPVGKLFTLILAGGVFFAAAYISDKKLRLRETSTAFYFLGTGFLAVINLGIAYFEWFGEYYTLKGGAEQVCLVISVSAFIVAVCMFAGGKIYGIRYLYMISYISLMSGIATVSYSAISVVYNDNVRRFLWVTIYGTALLISWAYVFKKEYPTKEYFIEKAVKVLTYAYAAGFLFLLREMGKGIAAPAFMIFAVLCFVSLLYMEDLDCHRIAAAVFCASCTFIWSQSLHSDIGDNIYAVAILLSLIFAGLFRFLTLKEKEILRTRYLSDWIFSAVLIVESLRVIFETELYDNADTWLLILESAAIILSAIAYWRDHVLTGENERKNTFRISVSAGIVMAIYIIGGIINQSSWVVDSSIGNMSGVICTDIILLILYLAVMTIQKGSLREIRTVSCIGLYIVIGLLTNSFYRRFLFDGSEVSDTVILIIFMLTCLILYVYKEYRKNNRSGVFTAACFLITGGLVSSIIKESLSYDHPSAYVWFIAILFLAIHAVGRLYYKQIVRRDEGSEYKSIDHMSLLSPILLLFMMHKDFQVEFTALWAVYFALSYKRVKIGIQRITLSIASVLAGVVWCMQEIKYIDYPDIIMPEVHLFGVLLITVLLWLIWKEFKKEISIANAIILGTGLTAYMIFFQSVNYSYTYKETYLKFIFYLLAVTAIWVVGHVRDNRVFLALSAIMLSVSLITAWDVPGVILILPVVMATALIFYLDHKEFRIPIIVLIAYLFVLLVGIKPPVIRAAYAEWYFVGLSVLFGLASYVWKDKKGYPVIGSIAGGIIGLSYVFMVCSFRDKAFFGETAFNIRLIIYLSIAVALAVYLYLKDMTPWGFIPMVQITAALIALDIPVGGWYIAYIVMLFAGYLCFREYVYDRSEKLRIDFITGFACVPIGFVYADGGDINRFIGKMMLALFAMVFYRRINKTADRIVLTFTSFVIMISWFTQPFVNIPDEWMTEMILLGAWAFIWFNVRKVYDFRENDTYYWIIYILTVISIIWQIMDSFRTERVADALVLGTVMTAMAIWAFITKRKQWFLLAVVTLVIHLIYTTRAFWMSIAWWVYLLAVGILFITLAAINEYRKRTDSVTERAKLFENWSFW